MVLAIAGAFSAYILLDQSKPFSKLREYRTRFKGLPDLLNYGVVVKDGVWLGKDGSLQAAFFYSGEDLDSASEDEKAAVARNVNAALSRRGTSWMYNIDALRDSVSSYPVEGAFANKTAWLLDEERRRQVLRAGARYTSEYALWLTFLPPVDAETSAADYLIEGKSREQRADALGRVAALFEGGLQDLQDALSSALQIRRMNTDEMLSYVVRCMTGENVALKYTPEYPDLDAYLGARDFYVGLKPRLGGEHGAKHIRPVAIVGFPTESYPGILDGLNRLGLCYRWSTRFIPLDQMDAEKQIEKIRKKWAQKRKSLKNVIKESQGTPTADTNLDAARNVNDCVIASGENAEGAVKFGYYTAVIVVMSDSEEAADREARDVVKLVNDLGFVARVEDLNAVEAYLGTLPGHGYMNVRRPIMHTANLSDLLPLTGVWPGKSKNPAPVELFPANSDPLAVVATTGATPFNLNLHVGDVGHSLIVGPTGAGKSVLLNFIAMQFQRYQDSQIFYFDKGYSSYASCNASGGAYYEIGIPGAIELYPLTNVHEPGEREWAQTWIESIVKIQTKAEVVVPHLKRAINSALLTIAESPAEMRTLGEFTQQLQDPDNELQQIMFSYTKAANNIAGNILDGRRDSIASSRFTVFEMQHIKNVNKEAQATLLLAIFHRIERELTHNRPTLIVLDEAWLYLDNPVFEEMIREWLKVLRKANASVVFATQEVNDILNSPIAETIKQACSTRIFLPNPEAADTVKAYESLRLTKGQIDKLARLTKKRQYYYISEYGRRVFELNLGPVALAFCAQSNADRVSKIKELMEIDVELWPAAWLHYLGAEQEAAAWVTLQPSGAAAGASMFGDVSLNLEIPADLELSAQIAPEIATVDRNVFSDAENIASLFRDIPLPLSAV